MRLILVTPDLKYGHHPVYARLIGQEAVSRGWDVRLLTSKEFTHSENSAGIQNQFSGVRLCGNLDFVRLRDAGHMDNLKVQMHYYRQIGDALRSMHREEPADFAYLTNLEYINRLAALLGWNVPMPFAGCIMRVHFHLHRMGICDAPDRLDSVHSFLFKRLLKIKNLKAILTADDTLPLYAAQYHLPNADKLRWFPEVTTSIENIEKTNAREELGIPQNKFVVLAYGSLTPRKGVVELLRAVANPACPQEVAVLMAGKREVVVDEMMKSDNVVALRKQGRLYDIPHFLDDHEESLAFSAADAVWVGYIDFKGPSGVTMQAAVCGVPVISTDYGIVGSWVRRYGTGICVDVQNVPEVTRAITALYEDETLRNRYRENSVKLRESFGPGAFAKSTCDAIEAVVSKQ